ncbi:AAA family ATPase [Nocardioides alkalitolerans]|uniref:AAA family ATPase n=1 Tax=Nocardioides alkalitolerans TaxID=281714 RepID=UPI00041C4093|nr:AAA family ATPase [Nocardioides alkalitolerans]
MIDGIGIGGYRSYGDLQRISPMGKVTVLAGQNNAGKSNVVRFVHDHLKPVSKGQEGEAIPKPAYAGGLCLEVGHRLATSDPLFNWAKLNPRLGSVHDLDRLASFFQAPNFRPTQDDLFWVRYRPAAPASQRPGFDRVAWEVDSNWIQEIRGATASYPHETPYYNAYQAMSGGNTHGGHAGAVDLIGLIWPASAWPQVEVVEAFRRVGPSATSADASNLIHSGEGLVERLARLQSPELETFDEERARFEAINRFARSVFSDESVDIVIPHNQDGILIRQGGDTRSLAAMGTGIHQVIIIAAAATVLQDHLVCIEEPEVNLHPLLQRKLMRYLHENTSNQYVVTTHSAHILDYNRADVVHIQKRDGRSTAQHVRSAGDASAVCVDLGYRPSDLIQTNCVIWVEGPSDRVYLRHWLDVLSSERLIEGIDYSVMFYGGRMLNSLTSDDPDAEALADDLISLRRLNRNSLVLIDSDKTTPDDAINATKRRIVEEYDRAGDRPGSHGFAWVTAGRTIENYVPPAVLSRAVNAAHPNATLTWDGSQWADPLAIIGGTPTRVDKVAVARAAVQFWEADAPLPLDLRERAAAIVAFVRASQHDD